MICQNCQHPKARHSFFEVKVGLCMIHGCNCDHYLAPPKPKKVKVVMKHELANYEEPENPIYRNKDIWG